MHKGELSSVDYLSVKQMETPPYRHRHVVPVEDSFSNVAEGMLDGEGCNVMSLILLIWHRLL